MSKNKRKKTDALTEYIKANRKGSREAEIALYGHPITYTKVAENKKKYKRCRDKYKGNALGIAYFIFNTF